MKACVHTHRHACTHTHTHFTHLFTERVDEGEKEENLDDKYDLMVRQSEPTWYWHLAQSEDNEDVLLLHFSRYIVSRCPFLHCAVRYSSVSSLTSLFLNLFQSRLVRNEVTHFYWTTRRDDIDCRSLRHDHMTNHYANAGTFTTKVSSLKGF